MFGKKNWSFQWENEGRKKIFMDLAEAAALWEAQFTMHIKHFRTTSKIEGKTRIIRIGRFFLKQSCMTILFIFNIVN